MTQQIREAFSEASTVSWSTLIGVIIAIATGVYGYGELSQRVANLEELRPLQLASDLAVIKANQARTIMDLGRVQADIAEMRRSLGTPRRWDRDSPERP